MFTKVVFVLAAILRPFRIRRSFLELIGNDNLDDSEDVTRKCCLHFGNHSSNIRAYYYLCVNYPAIQLVLAL